jgi:hypothetical protein
LYDLLDDLDWQRDEGGRDAERGIHEEWGDRLRAGAAELEGVRSKLAVDTYVLTYAVNAPWDGDRDQR